MQIPEELYQQVCEVAFSQAIISVGKALGLTVVAEGEENHRAENIPARSRL